MSPDVLVRTETPADGVARIVLNRAEKANAQNNRLLYDLDRELTAAARDGEVRVIILAGEGAHFSSGHDLSELDPKLTDVAPIGVWGGFDRPAQEGYMSYEEEAYFGLCWRWRNIPKPLIAEVQGRVIAGGLMLAWVCDLIVASETATFTDPVVTAGINGVEYFAHPWEVGPRKAKEMLFTGQGLTARAAERAGMVNRVTSPEALTPETLELAKIIAAQPPMGLRLAKLSVNAAQDEQGFYNSLRHAMALQHLAHAQHWAVHGSFKAPGFDSAMRDTLRREPLE